LKSIGDLARHNCIGFRLLASGGIYAWELREDGEDVSVRVTGTTLVNDATYARDLALAGVGIAYVFEPLVRKEIRDGTLRWVLPQAAIDEPGLFLYFPRRASEAPKLRAFIEVAREVLRPEEPSHPRTASVWPRPTIRPTPRMGRPAGRSRPSRGWLC
jgi:DNA-binding transcriptional LysR family regulator